MAFVRKTHGNKGLLPLLLIAVLVLASFVRPALSETETNTQLAITSIVSINLLADALEIPSEEKCCAKAEGHQNANHSRCLSDLTILSVSVEFGGCQTASIVWQDEYSGRGEQWRSALLRPPIAS